MSGAILTKKTCLGINRVKVNDEIELVDALIDSCSDKCLVKRDVLTDSIQVKIEPSTVPVLALYLMK